MPRRRALALIVRVRNDLLAKAAERLPSDAQPLYDDAAKLERLLLDVRACRIDEFELHRPTKIHVTISAY
ncbi:hypothetical protein [Paraburkholderia adhaesiva]|uniref:hypothetical protein n=1 Tax=Paraburkholderia adhaesiva TaxID=2883244 RepID=UPI001F19012B|nr:hypothetical protein [Paraburkholderia adhaesiva]